MNPQVVASPKTVSELAQLAAVLGPTLIVFLVITVAIVVLVAVALLSKSGIAIGKFRVGVRRNDSAPCGNITAEHTALLSEISSGIKEIRLHLEDQDQMLVGHGAVLEIVLDEFEGKEINGQVESARKVMDSNRAYHEALKRLLAARALPGA